LAPGRSWRIRPTGIRPLAPLHSYSIPAAFKIRPTGAFALFDNSTGQSNTAHGFDALFNNTEGGGNTANGAAALFSNTTGGGNTAVGAGALFSNSTGVGNTAMGLNALSASTQGSNNTALGAAALLSNATGGNNTAIGIAALSGNTIGGDNTATGVSALYSNTTGLDNAATGNDALVSNTTGGGNTAIGVSALYNNTTGDNNTAIGIDAGGNQTTGSNNVYIGAGMRGAVGESNACYIANIFGQTCTGGTQVFINSDGKLGTITSSRRFKDDIKPMRRASEVILALKPVTFQYKSDRTNTLQFGLIAEDVAEVNPDLVVRNQDGEMYTVRYDAVNAMLLNEFLKEHRKVQQLEANAAEQREEIKALAAAVKKQSAQIQKVRARVELSKYAPQVAGNSR
jgi:hypothetical protein